MKLFIVFLIAVLPAISFGLKCYKCDDCSKENPQTDKNEIVCKEQPNGRQYCTKVELNGLIILSCVGSDVSQSSFDFLGCGTGSASASGTNITTTTCYCKTDLCNTVDYNVPYTYTGTKSNTCPACTCNPNTSSGETKRYSLVGFTLAAAFSSTLLHKFSM